jgi:DNA modification methylase
MGEDEAARLVPTDQPYSVPIRGNVTKARHREFAMASGEMSEGEFLTFDEAWMRVVLPHLHEGGLLGTFIDWRGYPTANAAAMRLGLAPLNLIVWAKTNGGMGSLYRSQHELLPLFKKGSASHVNNVELGKASTLALERLDLSWSLVAWLRRPARPQRSSDRQADRPA